MSRDSEEKKKALNRWLIDEFALIHVSTKAADVVLPDHLKASPSVTLKLSKLFQGKLVVEDTHIEAELKFRGVYFNCKVPFSAVWGIESMKGERKMWMASTPPELISALLAQQVDPSKSAASTSRAPGDEPALKIVPTEGAPRKSSPLSLASKVKSAPGEKGTISPLRVEKAGQVTVSDGTESLPAATSASDEPQPPRPRGGRPHLKLIK